VSDVFHCRDCEWTGAKGFPGEVTDLGVGESAVLLVCPVCGEVLYKEDEGEEDQHETG